MAQLIKGEKIERAKEARSIFLSYNRAMLKRTLPLLLLIFLFTACKPKTLTPTNSIEEAVAAILTAQPQPTAQPTYTPYPTNIPIQSDLSGLFCEYQFCIGHPADTALFDVRDAKEPSLYSDGMLAAYRADYFNLIIWQYNNGSDDPQFMLDLIMDPAVDTRVGNLDINLLGDLTTFYTPLTNTTSIPVGGAAAWVCGDRAFGWKVYTVNEELALSLFQEAISKFDCIP